MSLLDDIAGASRRVRESNLGREPIWYVSLRPEEVDLLVAVVRSFRSCADAGVVPGDMIREKLDPLLKERDVTGLEGAASGGAVSASPGAGNRGLERGVPSQRDTGVLPGPPSGS